MVKISREVIYYLIITIPLALLVTDVFNTLDDRAFLDGFMISSNPYIDIRQKVTLFWEGYSWKVAWPYPPLTILLVWPAWFLYRITQTEWLFQIVFKLPQILSAIGVYMLLRKSFKLPTAAFLWLLNPLVIALSIQGGFQLVTVYLLLIFYVFWREKKYGMSLLFLGAATALRIYPAILFIPLVLHFWNEKIRKMILFSTVTFLLTFVQYLPFLFPNPEAFLTSFSHGQSNYLGPLGSWPLIHKAVTYVGLNIQKQSLYLCMSLLSGLSCLVWFLYAYRKRFPFLETATVGLALFYLFYPKIHMGYSLPVLVFGSIIAVHKMKNPFRFVWIPSLLFLLLVNGNFGQNGIFYLLLPYVRIPYEVPYTFYLQLVFALLDAVFLMIGILAIVKVLRIKTAYHCRF